jgi:topoisomerase-4 subunit A
MKPMPVTNPDSDWCLSISNEGRMLMFPLRDLPSLGKGKGNKLINIPSAKAQSREEYVKVLAVVPDGAAIKVGAGKRNMTLTADDLTHYQGERGRRGNKLPRGLQRVDTVEVVLPSKDETTEDLS